MGVTCFLFLAVRGSHVLVAWSSFTISLAAFIALFRHSAEHSESLREPGARSQEDKVVTHQQGRQPGYNRTPAGFGQSWGLCPFCPVSPYLTEYS